MEQVELPDRYPYQEYMFQKILHRKKTAVIGKPGCGKTRPIIDALVELECIDPLGTDPFQTFPNGSIFLMCSGPAIATWVRQFPQWINDPEFKRYIHVVSGNKVTRTAMWYRARFEPGIYICNFAIFRIDFPTIQSVQWTALIADEYHKVMRRRQSATFKFWRTFTRHQEIMILASGSLLSKDPGSMWTAFALIDPQLSTFRSYWRYLTTFCIMEQGVFGQEILGLKNVEQLKELMDRYFAYVPKEVIAHQQPKGVRTPLYVEMDKEQTKIYNQLTKDMFAVVGEEVVVASTIIGRILKHRQLLCCPKLLHSSLGMGAGYEAILDKLEDEPHVVIFVPFRDAVTYVVEDLRIRGYDAHPMMGGMDHMEVAETVERFRQKRGIIVCTIAFAESFDLETCDTSYFLGYDFNVEPNLQAEGRTQRAISKHEFVTWNYVQYTGTYDDVMLMNLNIDMANMARILKRPQELIDKLRGGE